MTAHTLAAAPPSSGGVAVLEREETLTAVQFAQVLQVGRATLDKLVAAGRAPKPFRVGRLVRWNKREVLAWIDASCPDAATWARMKRQPDGR